MRRSPIVGWAPVGLIPAVVLAVEPEPAWLFMWALAAALFAGVKWLTWWGTPTRAPAWRHAAYLALWPGLDARAFLAGSSPPPLAGRWLRGAAKSAVGAALVWVVAGRVEQDLIRGWTGMVGLILLLHFGTFDLLASAWRAVGIDARPLRGSRRPVPTRPVRTTWRPRAFLLLRGLAPAPRRTGMVEKPFEEIFLEQLRRAPWFLLSLAAHALFVGIVLMFPWRLLEAKNDEPVVVTIDVPKTEEFPPEPVEPPVVVDPVPVEPEVVPLDANLDPEDVLVDATAEATAEVESPFDAEGLNNVLGPGPGAGGPLRHRGGPRGPRVGTEKTLLAALDWLARHQDADGRWDSDGFAKHCEANLCAGPGEALHDVGVTGLALLAFLGDGHATGFGRYRDVVVSGVRWLVDQQDPDSGLLGERTGNSFLYDHSIAAIALCEAYNFSRSPQLRGPAQRATNFILAARNPYKAWRYSVPPDGDNDTSVTGWMVFALKAAVDAGLDVDRTAFEAALAWFDEVTDPATGRCGYTSRGEPSSRRVGMESRFPVEETESLTAVALLCRIFLGQTRQADPILRAHADRLRRRPPVWDVTPERSLVDEYYWYYGAFATFQLGGEDWRVWRSALEKALVPNQHQVGDEKGSWDPVGAWGRDGGRVYMTAIGALCLEVTFRYARILGARPLVEIEKRFEIEKH